jgi:hypothetical protein
MDLKKTLQELHAEREKLDRAITSLEELQRTGSLPDPPGSAKRRGRKSMNAAEREDVSKRMKKYWANRRKQKAAADKHPPG